jgi:hypothetical protein
MSMYVNRISKCREDVIVQIPHFVLVCLHDSHIMSIYDFTRPPMSTGTGSRLIMEPTLADVLDRLLSVESLSERRRRELASDVRSFCRIVELPAGQVVASTAVLRQLAQRGNRTAKRISHGRWCNILSGLRRATHLTGIRQSKFGLLPPPADVWQELLTLIASDRQRIVFLRFARYSSAMGIFPDQVNDAIIRQFRQALEEEALSDPVRKIASLCRAWNRAAQSLPSWPQQRLTAPAQPRRYGVPWSVFPVSLRLEIADYLAQSLAPDPLDEDAPEPVRASTIVFRRQILRELASARVNRGTPPADIQRIGDLVRPDALKDALRFFIDRAGNDFPRRIMARAILVSSCISQ